MKLIYNQQIISSITIATAKEVSKDPKGEIQIKKLQINHQGKMKIILSNQWRILD